MVSYKLRSGDVALCATHGGGKGGGSAYDPQIGAATSAAAATAAKAEAFSEKYYTEVITPLLKQQSTASSAAQAKLGKLYDLNADQMKLSSDRYKQYGIPAENKYYDMVSQYSAPEEQERQAAAAKGDLGVAQGNQRDTMMRNMSALGIDPSSPAAMAVMSDMAVANSAAEASAMNRARNAARDLGMKLKSDAANFGRGGQSGILQFGTNAGNNATGAFGVANAALQTGAQAGQGVMQGYQTALQGYNNNANVYGGLGQADIQAQAAGGIGSALGAIGGGLAGNTAIFSDRRLKENLQEIGELLSGIKIYSYNFIGETDREIGVIAQEVLPILPEAVEVDEDTGYYRVHYDMLR